MSVLSRRFRRRRVSRTRTRALHGRRRVGRRDLIKPSYHSPTQFNSSPTDSLWVPFMAVPSPTVDGFNGEHRNESDRK
eukprot:1188080-Prorocentrum_minimum.AAC.2